MVLVNFLIGALVLGLVLYSPFFLWFRLRERRAGGAVSQDLQFSLHRAFVDARSLSHGTLSVEHLLLALLDNPRVVDVLRMCPVDIDEVRRSVSAIVRDATPVVAGSSLVEPQASREFERVLQRSILRSQASARTAGGRDVSWPGSWMPVTLRKTVGRRAADGADALASILEEPGGRAVEELHRFGLTRLAVIRVIAHGFKTADSAAMPPLPAGGIGEMAVVVENDDYTPMEFVVDVLQRHLDLDLASATRAMLAIHDEGRADCGWFPADVASEKADRVRLAAAEGGHPLRCVVEPR